MSTKNLLGIESLESKFGPMTVGLFLKAFREADGLSQINFAKRLKLSRANLCDIEKERKFVSPERAAKIAKLLKVPEATLIKLSIQDMLRAAKLQYTVDLKSA
ncbi:MAG: helix-turn-helix transcriptional regulator [Deltaproteobacteria bacterium]|jgi:transcriptional regulator with XRE-family HTH domain|nr:helix-turn-helix transcriptional regulator [Deltaproteobacteria bacterium]